MESSAAGNLHSSTPLQLSITTDQTGQHQTEDTCPTADVKEWLQDLELMHHYAYKTCKSRLGASTRLQHIFTEQIPVEATKHAFLMHGVLALSALHLAHLNPTQKVRYTYLCDRHQASALALYRLNLTRITDNVAIGLFALSTILSISSLARATLKARESPEPKGIGTDDICELLYLTRGVRDLKEACEDLITKSPFSVVLYGHQLDDDLSVKMSPRLFVVFRDLKHMVENHCLDLSQRKVCAEATAHLESVYETLLTGLSSGPGFVLETGHLWRWTAMLSYDFIKLVQARFPPALVITAHFAVVNLMLRDLWYVGSWGSLAFDGIRLALNGQLNEYLVWGQEQIDTDNAGLKHSFVSTGNGTFS